MVIREIEELLDTGIPAYDHIPLKVAQMTSHASKSISDSITAERKAFGEATDRLEKVIDCKKKYKLSNLLDTIVIGSNQDTSHTEITSDVLVKYRNIFAELASLDYTKGKHHVIATAESRLKDFDDRVRYVRNNSYSTAMHNGLKQDFNEIYYAREYGEDLRQYLNSVNRYYHACHDNLSEISEIETRDLIEEYVESLDVQKLAVMIVKRYLVFARIAIESNDIYSAQKYLFVVTSFMKNKLNRNLIKENNNLKISYKELLKDYPILRELELSRSLFTSNTFEDNQKVIESLLTMDKSIISEFFIKQSKTDEKKEPGETRGPRRKVTEEERQYIEDYISQRLYTYLVNEPIMQLEPSSKFKDYAAFVYPNGQIIADRIYKLNTMSEIKKDAAYVFDAENFDRLIKHGKQELIPIVPRIIHHEGWEQEVAEYAKKETSNELKEAIKTLKK